MKIHASINRMVNKEDSAIKAYASGFVNIT